MNAKGGEKKSANRNQPKPERLRRILANMPAAMLSAVQVRKNNIWITLLCLRLLKAAQPFQT